ncbi:hypothetical protein BGW38_010006, partial [Lunasporangiospora selenospora]
MPALSVSTSSPPTNRKKFIKPVSRHIKKPSFEDKQGRLEEIDDRTRELRRQL